MYFPGVTTVLNLTIYIKVLLPKIGGGRVAVPEILVTNHAIANLIREDKVHQIYSQMQLGQGQTGMQTQTQELIKLVQKNVIKKDHALQYSNKPDELKKNINF